MTPDEAHARAALLVDAWIKDRSINLHRDDRWWLVEKIAEELSKPAGPVEPEGIS